MQYPRPLVETQVNDFHGSNISYIAHLGLQLFRSKIEFTGRG